MNEKNAQQTSAREARNGSMAPLLYSSYGYQPANHVTLSKLDYIIHKIQQLGEKMDTLEEKLDALMAMHSPARKRKSSPAQTPGVPLTMAQYEELQDSVTELAMLLHH